MVMKCANKRTYDGIVGVVERIMCYFISVCRNVTSSETFYAGLIICFVPTILCQTDWSRKLTFEKIYNSTNYAQLQSVLKPYSVPVNSVSANGSGHAVNYNDVTRENEVDGSYRKGSSPLLVGFARDPFRYSVPERDYLNGVRHIEDYMSKADNRGKRGVLHLYNMIQCATSCDPLSYKGYGCYCGFLGSGRPTDGIDRCCKIHDQCYENIRCPFYTVYLQPYYWKCYRGQPLCALENYRTRNQFINGCSGRLCDCDRQFAMCIQRYRCPRGRALCRSDPLRLLQNILMFR